MARVRSVIGMGGGLHSVELVVDPRTVQAARPGRYVMLTVADGTDPFLARPYWVRRSSESTFHVLVKEVGRGGRWLARAGPGDAMWLFGPLGKELVTDPATRRLLLFGDLRALNLLLALSDEALRRGLEVAIVIEADESPVPATLLPAALELLPELDGEALRWADELYCAGEPVTVQKAQDVVRASGGRLPATALPHAPMACGVGACHGCVISTKRGSRLSCVDGPAFPLRELVWT